MATGMNATMSDVSPTPGPNPGDLPRVLLVDDDAELSELLAEYLRRDGFDVTAVGNGTSAIALVHGHGAGNDTTFATPFDIVVLDVMMPGIDGIEVLRRIRSDNDVPVLMLTARGDDVDRIVGLELGADDYVAKPCTPRELAARLRAILRRAREARDCTIPVIVGPLEIRPAQRRADWRGAPLALTSTEFDVLATLVRHAGRVVEKTELSQQALGRPLGRFDRSLDVHVSNLRQKLEPRPDGTPWIETVRGRGYQFLLP